MWKEGESIKMRHDYLPKNNFETLLMVINFMSLYDGHYI